jgi:hypothetical protein
MALLLRDQLLLLLALLLRLCDCRLLLVHARPEPPDVARFHLDGGSSGNRRLRLAGVAVV